MYNESGLVSWSECIKKIIFWVVRMRDILSGKVFEDKEKYWVNSYQYGQILLAIFKEYETEEHRLPSYAQTVDKHSLN